MALVLKTIEVVACVAGGISRASAFVLVAKTWTEVAKPWEDWWRVELNSPLANSSRASSATEYGSRIPPATQAIEVNESRSK